MTLLEPAEPVSSIVENSDAATSLTRPLAIMVTLYFVWGFITVLNDLLIPHLKALFRLSNVQAMLVQFSFFGAYFVMSLPAGRIIHRIGYRRSMTLALLTMGAGLLLFVPAASLPSYAVFLIGLFIAGGGITVLQVAANPYVAALGPPRTAASRLNLAGTLNSLATTIGPRVGAALIFLPAGASAAAQVASIQRLYIAIAVACAAFALAIALSKLPELASITRAPTASSSATRAWQFRHLRWGAAAIFAYVGAEVAIGSILISYLGQQDVGGMNATTAATYVSLYWGGALVGRAIGVLALRRVAAASALMLASACAMILVLAGIAAPGMMAGWAVVAVGLFNSVMWPCIFSLALRGLGSLTSEGSGLLVMMVVGGAVVPVAQGWLADVASYRASFLAPLLCYAVILSYGMSAERMPRMKRLAFEGSPETR